MSFVEGISSLSGDPLGGLHCDQPFTQIGYWGIRIGGTNRDP